jgi:hypothetical protein
MRRALIALSAGAVLAGCSSLTGPHQEYNSPRVTGRVLDAATRQPLPKADIRRLGPDEYEKQGDPSVRKGGERMAGMRTVLTDKEGRFVLESVKSFYLLVGYGVGDSVGVVIQHRGYATLRTNFTATAPSLHNFKGPPEVHAGDIFLNPARH